MIETKASCLKVSGRIPVVISLNSSNHFAIEKPRVRSSIDAKKKID